MFDVDYAVKGTLTTNFTYPFNSDAEVMLPFVVVEARKDGTVRMRAPGFGMAPGQNGAAAGIPMMNDPSDKAEGRIHAHHRRRDCRPESGRRRQDRGALTR